MQTRRNLIALISLVALLAGAASAQEGAKQKRSNALAAAGSEPVVGSGTPGRISKWSGVFGTETYSLGNSNIYEDKYGKVGIGIPTPTSLLTVQGMIETTLGGYKFPDGTVQTTAGISFVAHDASLTGLGTAASPLGIAAGGVNTVHLANSAVTAAKIANGTVVRSFNGLFDNVTLAAGPNITITPSGNTLTIAAPNSLTSVAHDSTLAGDGTPTSLLGVAAGGIGNTQLADNAVTLSKIAVNQVVTSLNGLKEDVTLAAGSNISISKSGNTLTVAGTGGATTVAYHAVSDIVGALDAPGVTVVTKQVPAGSYFISFRISAYNHDDSAQNLSCTLSTGDSTRIRLAGDDALGGTLVLQDVATFQAPATISVHCIGFQMVVFGKTTLTALKVGSIQ